MSVNPALSAGLTEKQARVQAELARRLASVNERIATAARVSGRSRADITLVAVSKTVTADVVAGLAALGVSDFGENRPQELWRKHAAAPELRWHFIGHLQRNKLEKTLPLVHLMHSVDSERLLQAIQDFGMRHQPVPILLEINCSREAAKGGIPPEEALRVGELAASYPGVRLLGLMTMAAFHPDPELCRPTFAELRTIRDQLRTRTGLPLPELSMGMSNDYGVAIEEGATLVRIGSTLFADLPASAPLHSPEPGHEQTTP